ncbi:hypothetical protein KC349_g8297 [Hortaea werneckii]|nr:hypothetical protein KC349_g8297 [Hortaea werneckii]
MPTAINIPDFLRDDFDCNQHVRRARYAGYKAKCPGADACNARDDQKEYHKSIAASDSIDKDDKIAILEAALHESDGIADTMSMSFLGVHITLQKLAHIEFALLTTQRHLDQLKGRMDSKDVASTHVRGLQQAELRVNMPRHKYTFHGSGDEQLRAAYEFFVLLAAGRLDYGLSQEEYR